MDMIEKSYSGTEKKKKDKVKFLNKANKLKKKY